MDSHESRSSRPPPPVDSHDISKYVLKITYLGVLRRLVLLAGDVIEANFSFSFLKSRAKALFSLSEDSPVAFTYVDSDGDVVAMADDDDLRDALMLQGLNPLRITMTEGGSKVETKYPPIDEEKEDDLQVTEVGSKVETKYPLIDDESDDDLQAPEPFDGIPDVIAENNEVSDFGTRDHGAQGEVDESVKNGEQLNQRSDVLGEKDCIFSVPSLEGERKEDRPSKGVEAFLQQPSFQTSGHATQAVQDDEIEAYSPPPSASEIQVEGGRDVNSDSSIAFENDVPGKSLEDVGKGVLNSNSEVASLDVPSLEVSSLRSGGKPIESGESESEGKGEAKDIAEGSNSQEAGEESRNVHYGIRCDGCGMNPITGPRFKSCKKSNYDLCLGCFDVREEAERAEYVEINRRFYRLVHPSFDFKSLTNVFGIRNLNDSHLQAENSANEGMRVLHPGVQCDECGVTPITGPRFKSSKRFNYDLCLFCYERSGSDDKEYSCLNVPTPSKGLNQITPFVSKILRIADQKLTSICERCVRMFDPPWAPDVDQVAGRDDDMPLLADSNAAPESTVNVGADGQTVDPACASLVAANSVPSSSVTTAIGARAESGASHLISMMHTLDPPALHLSQNEEVVAEASKPSSTVDKTDSNTEAAFGISSKLKELVGVEVDDAPSTAESHGQGEIDSEKRDESCYPAAAPETECLDEVNVPELKADFKTPTEVSPDSQRPKNLEATGGFAVDCGLWNPQAGETKAQTGENVDEEEKELMKLVMRVLKRSGEMGSPDDALQQEELVSNSDASPEEDLAPLGKVGTPQVLVLTEEEEEASGDESDSDISRADQLDEFAELEAHGADREEDVSALQKLMAKLEGMGFSDEALNKELLEKHDLDLRKTLDDLCEADDWDQMLGDLQEMGFYDENMNRGF